MTCRPSLAASAAVRLSAGLCLSILSRSHAQIYTATPQWQSTDATFYSTGGAVADFNRDGWPDLVVANGNDIERERVVVYYNNGSGTLATTPAWQSADIAFNGHLDVADVNGDGWPDVAVAVLLAQGGPAAKVYLNNNGTLSSNPAWVSSVSQDSFGCAFGDVNADGRPDLLIASGDAYNAIAYRNVVYLNTGGTLGASPHWQTAANQNFGNCAWVDADRDGILDAAMAGTRNRSMVYRGLGGTLSTTANWQTTDTTNGFGLMVADGDVNGDGRRDLFIVDNNQLASGTGTFRQYNGLAAGYYSTAANWSYFDGYTAAVTLGDLDRDGDLDLVTGEWFGRTRYFLNTGAALPAAPNWTSGGSTTTVEKLILADINRNGVRRATAFIAPQPGRRLYYLPRQPVERIIAVEIDGVELPPSQWTSNREAGWVAIGVGVFPTSDVRVHYEHSLSLDLAVTNWDNNRPNQVYYNQLAVPCAADFDADGFVSGVDFDLYVQAFEAGDFAADFDGDGFLTGVDFDMYVQAFDGGC